MLDASALTSSFARPGLNLPEESESLLQQLFQFRFEGRAPDFVAGFGQMQVIGHGRLGNRAIWLDQLGTEIDVMNHLAIRQFSQGLVDLQNLAALSAEG